MLARRFAKAGLVDEQIAELLGISIRALYDYKNESPEFLQALKEGAEDPKARVKRALYQRAVGYTHEEDKVFLHEGKAVIVKTTKHYPPDPKCIEFYLINKCGDEFKNISHVQASGSVDHNHKGKVASAFVDDMNRLLVALGENAVHPAARAAGAVAPGPTAPAVTKPGRAKPAPAPAREPEPPQPPETSEDLRGEEGQEDVGDELTFTPADYAAGGPPEIPLDLSDIEGEEDES